jgi:hypothetical protein
VVIAYPSRRRRKAGGWPAKHQPDRQNHTAQPQSPQLCDLPHNPRRNDSQSWPEQGWRSSGGVPPRRSTTLLAERLGTVTNAVAWSAGRKLRVKLLAKGGIVIAAVDNVTFLYHDREREKLREVT